MILNFSSDLEDNYHQVKHGPMSYHCFVEPRKKKVHYPLNDIPKQPRDALEFPHIAAYSVGHLNNDLGAALLSTYQNWYLSRIVKMDPTDTGLVFLYGQIADGIATVIVGYLSDKYNTRIGKR